MYLALQGNKFTIVVRDAPAHITQSTVLDAAKYVVRYD